MRNGSTSLTILSKVEGLALMKENKELWKRLKQSHFCAIAPLDFLLSFGSCYVLKQFSIKEGTDKIGGYSIQEVGAIK